MKRIRFLNMSLTYALRKRDAGVSGGFDTFLTTASRLAMRWAVGQFVHLESVPFVRGEQAARTPHRRRSEAESDLHKQWRDKSLTLL